MTGLVDGGRPLADRIEQLRELIDTTDDVSVLEAIAIAARAELPWEPQQHQLPPLAEFWTWVFQGGRGTGKTDTGADWLDKHMKGPPCDPRWPGGHKGLLLGPTHGDTISSCVRGVTGLRAHNIEIRLVGRKDGTYAVWPGGAEAVVLGMHTANDAERLRAQAANCCCWWIDEAAIGRHLQVAIDNLAFGARLPQGKRPQGIATTTPKPTPQYRAFLRMPGVVRTVASSYQNKFLSDDHRELIAHYEGTRLGRQEIHGELVDDYEGALFQRATIALDRIDDEAVLALDEDGKLSALSVVRTMAGIDPSTWIPEVGAPTDDEQSQMYQGGAGIETGLVVAGIDRRWPPHVYVFDDLSGRVAAIEWARRAASAYHRWHSTVVPETNAGGDMVLATIQLTDPDVPVFRETDPTTLKPAKKPGVRASIGKRARAEPVGALSDQHRLHMVGEFPELESTLCFPAGTSVLTANGAQPIETVERGVRVATRAGWRRVVDAGTTGTTGDLLVVSHGLGSLTCTADHRLWTDECGYVPARLARPGLTLRLSPADAAVAAPVCPSCGGDAGGGSRTGATSGTSSLAHSTEPSTRPTSDRSPTGTTSITAMRTRSTTGPRTSSRLRPPSTSPVTNREGSASGAPNGDPWRLDGGGRPEPSATPCAWCAERRSGPSGSAPGTAPASVSGRPRGGLPRLAGRRMSARTAAWSSSRPDALASARIVAVNAITVAPQPVYDLTVDDAHEFLADGVLVHNCGWDPTENWSPDRMDALVWAVHALQPWRRRGRAGAGGGGSAI